MMKKLFFGLFSLIYSVIACGQSVEEVHTKLHEIYPNLLVTSIKESQIPGLYEVLMPGAKLIYYFPDKNYLVFGEIFTSEGESLSAATIAALNKTLVSELPLQEALIIGPKDGKPIIEFTDPVCPYCHEYNEFAIKEPNLKRIIFFYTDIHPEKSPKIVEHIFCSDNPEMELTDIYKNGVPRILKSCDKGKRKTEAHNEISRQFGVKGTPTLVLGERPLVGFKRDVVESYINQNQKGENP